MAGLFIVVQMVAMGMAPAWPWLNGVLELIGRLPSAVVVMTGMAIGASASWLGWQAGKQSTPARGREELAGSGAVSAA